MAKHPAYADLANVTVTDPFFAPFLDRIRTVSAPDILKKFLAEGAIGNYERVARRERGGHVGPPWYHGLICECIRGISDLLVAHYDQSLDEQMDFIIEKIAAAQDIDPEGYINPYTTLMCPEKRWGLNGGNIRWQHETYDAGALVEAAVHHFRATGKTSLLKVAVKMANYLASVIGPAPKWNVTAEHSLPEMALAELEQLVREYPDELASVGAIPGEYLRLACALIDN
ncbi:MAG: glycoside hydrolase family 127 protein, partial [Clostridia bacterium]|nr:glycoside hydrolase family 127 protein [Clostridia bacterium]